ncbi:MAG: hypothetical protein E3J64_08480 [Anaerolineales bacterium]|nr:MAG: hypothetical protein E3J64_08480 [Anaerolineales bacterium]
MLLLTAAALVAAALILRSTLPGGGTSPLPTPSAGHDSPLPGPLVSPLDPGTPAQGNDARRPLLPGAAAALFWVALGIVLSLSLAAIVRRLLHAAE